MSPAGDESSEEESQGGPDASRICTELSTVLDAQRLRGVPLHWALQLRHWANVEGQVSQATNAKNYSDLSRPVKALDSFVSHDWASSGFLKVLSLLIIYNSRAAFCTSLVVSILVGVLRGFGRLPNEHWTVVFGFFSFFVVFGFWPQLLRPFRRPTMVFVDKLCIAQHDAGLKRDGIMGMPAFLLNSNDLIILFTSNYCKRLWCCFEMGTFLKDVSRQRNIRIMPLMTAQLLCLASGIWFLLVIGWNVLYYEFITFSGEIKSGQNPLTTGMVLNGVMLLVAAAAVLPLFYLGIELVAEMDEAVGQLAAFSVQDADCFCCSINHRHPRTGAQLPCDRQMMYSMLSKWYAPEREGLESDRLPLDKFDLKIRKELAPRIVAVASGFALPWNYTLYMVGASSVPYIADPIARWIAAYNSDDGLSGYAFFVWSLRVAARWGTVALASLLAVRISLPLWKLGLRVCWKDSRKVRWLIVLLTSMVVVIFTSLVWGSVFFSLGQTADDQLLPVLLLLCWFLCACGLHWRFSAGRSFHGSDAQTKHTDQSGATKSSCAPCELAGIGNIDCPAMGGKGPEDNSTVAACASQCDAPRPDAGVTLAPAVANPGLSRVASSPEEMVSAPVSPPLPPAEGETALATRAQVADRMTTTTPYGKAPEYFPMVVYRSPGDAVATKLPAVGNPDLPWPVELPALLQERLRVGVGWVSEQEEGRRRTR
ncbi:unnamed protein product [Symbiodinium sp. CCMP2456]|nr:unnamed protein product [Symbiodinium sp. CCMP2456]